MSSLRSVSEWSTFTEDMRQESIKSLSLFLMLQYLEEKHTSEKPSDFHTMFLNILTGRWVVRWVLIVSLVHTMGLTGFLSGFFIRGGGGGRTS